MAQTKRIDSLKTVLRNEKEDSIKVNNLNQLVVELYHENKYITADSMADCAMQIAKKLNYKIGIGVAYENMGTVSCMQGRFTEGLKNYEQALSIEEEVGDKAAVASTHGNKGLAYYQQGKYPEALKEELMALKFDEESGDKSTIADQCGNIGNIYNIKGNEDDALKQFTRSLDLYTGLKNKEGIAMAYGNIGNIYQDKGNDSAAIRCQERALKINEEIGQKYGIGNAYANIGGIYYGERNYDKAYKNELLAMKEYHAINDAQSMASVAEIIGSNFIQEKKFAEAKQYLDSSLDFTKITGAKTVLRDVYYDFTALDSALGNYRQSIADYEKFIAYRDGINNEASTRKLVSEQLNYEFDKKLALQKEEEERKNIIAETSKKRQVIISVSVSVALLLVIIFSGLLSLRFRVTQKQKKIIEQQKQLVEEKNKDILDSITYAKHLQDAILPPLNVIKKYLPETFILYKPKDIVAGDFYWMENIGDTIFIAACDCTGHGVPGAMVSVVCSNALNRSVKEFKITEPGKILDKARELVLETFEKSEGDIKDGMDVSIAAISYQPMANGLLQMQWSGANNPLWYMHKNEFKEIIPDKQPVGKQEGEKPFSTHTIELSKGDTIYLFTDGYADQFGGPKGKKFKYKQIREKLVAISHLPLAEQKQELERTFESWRGNLEQVDDVLIMGILV